MFGLSGEIDFRILHQRIASGSAEQRQAAQLAYDVYIHRLKKYVGAYLAVLGHTDVIAFTAGVGEHDPLVRRDALSGLESLGVELDERVNELPSSDARVISADSSRVTVMVIPTNEELAIAQACLDALGCSHYPVCSAGNTSAIAPRLLNAIPATRARGSRGSSRRQAPTGPGSPR